MEDRKANNFSFTIFFVVTGASFLMFSLLMHWLDIPHVNLFLKTGVVSTIIAVPASLLEWMASKMPAERRAPQEDVF